MLTEICAYLNNWFDVDEYHKKLPALEGRFSITGGKLAELAGLLAEGQLFYIYGSIFNDGVHVFSESLTLHDETFKGLIQSMRTEPDFLKICNEIEAWQEKHGQIDSPALSPYQSESFGTYSYSKGYSGVSGNGAKTSSDDPFSVYAARLNRWRKL